MWILAKFSLGYSYFFIFGMSNGTHRFCYSFSTESPEHAEIFNIVIPVKAGIHSLLLLFYLSSALSVFSAVKNSAIPQNREAETAVGK